MRKRLYCHSSDWIWPGLDHEARLLVSFRSERDLLLWVIQMRKRLYCHSSAACSFHDYLSILGPCFCGIPLQRLEQRVLEFTIVRVVQMRKRLDYHSSAPCIFHDYASLHTVESPFTVQNRVHEFTIVRVIQMRWRLDCHSSASCIFHDCLSVLSPCFLA